MKDLSYYEEHPEELTEEITAKLMLGGQVEGDTEADEAEEDGEAPAAVEEEPKDDEAEKEEPVVLAKDGKHTIPFEELEKARQDAKQWEQASREKDALIEQLKSAKAQDEASGDTQATDELLESLREDYPMLADAMQKLVDMKVNEAVASVKRAIEPLQQRAETTALEAHFNAIRQAHEDYESLVEGGKLDEWVKALPAYARSGALRVIEEGNAQEVIELLDAFKSATPADPTPSKEDIAKKAQQAIAKAKDKTTVPRSLSDVPSGGLPASEELGAFTNMSDTAIMGAFMKMDPNKINEKLARLL